MSNLFDKLEHENDELLSDNIPDVVHKVVQAAVDLTVSLKNDYGDPEWFYKYNGGLDGIACIACESFLGDAHEEGCPAKALDDALKSLLDSPSEE